MSLNQRLDRAALSSVKKPDLSLRFQAGAAYCVLLAHWQHPQKYFSSSPTQITSTSIAIPHPKTGAYRDHHGRWARDGRLFVRNQSGPSYLTELTFRKWNRFRFKADASGRSCTDML
jgi:hypothetical protein